MQPPFAVHTAISTTLPALALPSRSGRLRRNGVKRGIGRGPDPVQDHRSGV